MHDNRSAADIAAEAMEGLDEQLNPIDDKVVATEEKAHVDEEEKEDSSKATVEEDDGSSGHDDSGSDEDEGYSIDEAEGEQDDSDKEDKQPEEQRQVDQNDLTPEQKYIVDNLRPLKIRGMVGDSDEVKEFEVYDPVQLPQGFKYIDDRDRDVAGKAFNQMENRAQQLLNDYRGQESQKAAKAFKEAEERADWQDIADLQRSGDLIKFKVKPSDAKFDQDPASQLIEKVLDFKDSINADYLEKANAGAPYRHIGFEDAYRRYVRENPQQGRTDDEKKEDTERKELAKRTRGAQGDDARNTSKAPRLSNKQDIDTFIDSLDW